MQIFIYVCIISFSLFLVLPGTQCVDRMFVVESDRRRRGIYMAENSGPPRSFVDAPFHQLCLSGIGEVLGVDFDHRTDTIYWTDKSRHTVHRARIDITFDEEPDILFINSSSIPHGIALDTEHNKVYWTDDYFNTITMANLDGTDRQTVIQRTGFEAAHSAPEAIVVSLKRGMLYWTDRGGAPIIEMSSLRGENRSPLVERGVADPIGLTLDYAEDMLYFTDATFGKIECISLDDHSLREIAVGRRLSLMDGFALHFEDFYISDHTYGRLLRADMPGPVTTCFGQNTFLKPTEIHIYADKTCHFRHDCRYTSKCVVVKWQSSTSHQHTCLCLPGYSGDLCQDIDECASSPCQNGATCHNLENAFSCSCANGFEGTTCDQAVCFQPKTPSFSYIINPKGTYRMGESLVMRCDVGNGSVRWTCTDGAWLTDGSVNLGCDHHDHGIWRDDYWIPVIAIVVGVVLLGLVAAFVILYKRQRQRSDVTGSSALRVSCENLTSTSSHTYQSIVSLETSADPNHSSSSHLLPNRSRKGPFMSWRQADTVLLDTSNSIQCGRVGARTNNHPNHEYCNPISLHGSHVSYDN